MVKKHLGFPIGQYIYAFHRGSFKPSFLFKRFTYFREIIIYHHF